MKTCTKCQTEKPLSSFHKDVHGAMGVKSRCKDCLRESFKQNYQAKKSEYAARNRQFRIDNPDYERSRHRLYTHGVTDQQFTELLTRQEYRCAICKKPVDKSAHLDHNHETGKIRGVLCSNCNRGIGHMQECPSILSSAIQYLEAHAQ